MMGLPSNTEALSLSKGVSQYFTPCFDKLSTTER